MEEYNEDLKQLDLIIQKWIAAFSLIIGKEDAEYLVNNSLNTSTKYSTKEECIADLTNATAEHFERWCILTIDTGQYLANGRIANEANKIITDLEIASIIAKKISLSEQLRNGDVNYLKAIEEWIKIDKKGFNNLNALIFKEVATLSHTNNLEAEKLNKEIAPITPIVSEANNNSLVNSTKPHRTFLEYLNISNKEEFAQKLKCEFLNEKGKDIAFLIASLKEKTIINLGNGNYNKFYEAMEVYFGRSIGAISGLNKYKDFYKQGSHLDSLGCI